MCVCVCVCVYFMELENSCCRIEDEAMVKTNYFEPHNIIVVKWINKALD